MTRPRAAMSMSADLPVRLFDVAARDRLETLVDVHDTVLTEFRSPAARRVIRDTEVLITGWHSSPVDPEVLATAPQLRAVVHTAGTVKGILHPACWERGIWVCNAASANAVSVAEYTLAMIILTGKDAFSAARCYQFAEPHQYDNAVGNRGRNVGVVGASRVGRRVVELLRPHGFHVLLSDPYVDRREACRLGATWSELDETVAASSVLSLHAPATPETRHMIDRRRLALLPDGATLINTARGSLVDEAALIRELESGRINAVLDVTDPEPPAPGSALRTLPNVVLTPHIAGSIGNELGRLGEAAVDEIARYVAGQPFRDEIRVGDLATTA